MLCDLTSARDQYLYDDQNPPRRFHAHSVAALYGKRLANVAWLTNAVGGQSVCFKSAVSERNCAIFLSDKYKEKHQLVSAILEKAARSPGWELIASAAEFERQRLHWDSSHWKTQQKLREPLACVSQKHDVHEPLPNKGWCTLSQMVQKLAMTRS